jgi:PPK2 family polyphosphate:nucleotide phosphotransferase
MEKSQRKLVHRYRVRDGEKFRLADYDPADTAGLDLDEEKAAAMLAKGVAELEKLQAKLYAEHRWSLLLVFQAMDAAGKDSTIKHVMSGVNPQGCQVFSFKAPSPEELDHDFLWRAARALPERGRIGIFNRSYYEEVLVVRVHPEILANEKLPSDRTKKSIWEDRYQDIRAFERHLDRNGTVVLKFFLNVSRKEQRKRFLSRLDDPEKNWKFETADLGERRRWDDYMEAYEDMLRATSTKRAPWHVVPADHKWFTRLAVAATIVEALESMRVDFPEIDAGQRRRLVGARRALLREK